MTEKKEKDGKKVVESKAILIGDAYVGKTSLIRVATGHKFLSQMESTTSINCTEKIIKIGSLNYSVNLWDTVGQELYSNLNSIFFRGADIVILVYDVTNKNSFDSLEKWIKNVEDNTGSKSKYVCGIVGNKKDLVKEQIITDKMGKEYAKSKNMKFRMVSAKTDPIGFNKFLEELVKDDIDNLLSKEENIILKKHKKSKKICNC